MSAGMKPLGVLGRNALLVAAHRLAQEFDEAGSSAADEVLALAERRYIEAVIATLRDFAAPADDAATTGGDA